MTNYPCPHCQVNQFETVRKAMYARGFILAYQTGTKTFIGCVSCVARELRAETGKSLLYGWFSVNSFVLNLFYIPAHFLRSFMVKPDPKAVSIFLMEAGIPGDDDQELINKTLYIFAATMIKADGEIDASEIEAAIEIGSQIIDDFDEAEFHNYLNSGDAVSDIKDLGGLLNEALDEEAKELVLKYLLLIASADGEYAVEEQTLMLDVSDALGLEQSTLNRIEEELLADA